MAEIKRLRPKHNKKLDKTIHNTWGMMKNRCYNTNSPDYKNWGGRGIRVCDKWLFYEGFLEDMIETYKKGLTLDRIDNNGNYCKENCRWVTRLEQNNNTRTVRPIKWNGLKMSLPRWAEKLGIKRSTLAMRHYKYHWPIERAFSTPIQGRNLL